MTAHDKVARTGNQLRQALSQVSETGANTYLQRTAVFVAAAQRAAAAGDLRDDVDSAEVGEAIWVAVLGCFLLSSAIGDDVSARLARMWQVLIPAIVPERTVAYFREFLARTAHCVG